MADSETVADRLVLKRLARRRIVWVITTAFATGLWLLVCHWAERHFGVDRNLLYFGTILVIVSAGILVAATGTRVAKLIRWTPAVNPAMTPYIRWLQTERSIRYARRLRIYLTILVAVGLLQNIAASAVADGHSFIGKNWSLIGYLTWGYEFCWPTSDWLADELTQARRLRAARFGYSAMMSLGLAAAIYSFYRPGFAVPALPIILLVGVLTSLIRMAWLEGRSIPGAPNGPAPPNSVRKARLRQGLTWEALAEQMGVPSRTVEAVEDGWHEPSTHLSLSFARALDTSVEALFTVSALVA